MLCDTFTSETLICDPWTIVIYTSYSCRVTESSQTDARYCDSNLFSFVEWQQFSATDSVMVSLGSP